MRPLAEIEQTTKAFEYRILIQHCNELVFCQNKLNILHVFMCHFSYHRCPTPSPPSSQHSSRQRISSELYCSLGPPANPLRFHGHNFPINRSINFNRVSWRQQPWPCTSVFPPAMRWCTTYIVRHYSRWRCWTSRYFCTALMFRRDRQAHHSQAPCRWAVRM